MLATRQSKKDHVVASKLHGAPELTVSFIFYFILFAASRPERGIRFAVLAVPKRGCPRAAPCARRNLVALDEVEE